MWGSLSMLVSYLPIGKKIYPLLWAFRNTPYLPVEGQGEIWHLQGFRCYTLHTQQTCQTLVLKLIIADLLVTVRRSLSVSVDVGCFEEELQLCNPKITGQLQGLALSGFKYLYLVSISLSCILFCHRIEAYSEAFGCYTCTCSILLLKSSFCHFV